MTSKKTPNKDKTKEVSEEQKRKKSLKKLRQENEEDGLLSEMLDEADDATYELLKKLK